MGQSLRRTCHIRLLCVVGNGLVCTLRPHSTCCITLGRRHVQVPVPDRVGLWALAGLKFWVSPVFSLPDPPLLEGGADTLSFHSLAFLSLLLLLLLPFTKKCSRRSGGSSAEDGREALHLSPSFPATLQGQFSLFSIQGLLCQGADIS